MSNASNNSNKSKTVRDQANGNKKQSTVGRSGEKSTVSKSDDKSTVSRADDKSTVSRADDGKGVDGRQQSNGKNGAKSQSGATGNTTNNKNNDSNTKDVKGGNGKPGENIKNGGTKSGRDSAQSSINKRGKEVPNGKQNGIASDGEKSGKSSRQDVNGSNGSNAENGRQSGTKSSTQPAESTTPISNSRNRAASDTKTVDARATSRISGGSKPDDGTTDAGDSRKTSATTGGNVGLQKNPNWGRSNTGTSADQFKRPNNNNVHSSYNSSTGPFGEKVERVMESPRPRDQPRRTVNKAQQKRRTPETPAAPSRSPPQSAKSETLSLVAEDDVEMEPCEKCGVGSRLLQSEACEHRVCEQCLPEDVDGIKVDTDCPVCQRKFLYHDAPGRSDQPTLNRFHLIKDIYDAIRLPSCQRCQETNQTTEDASCACRDCSLYLCEPCADAHNTENFSEGKGWKNHHIFLLEELKERDALPPVKAGPSTAEELLCPKHEDVAATCYCQTCKQAYCAPCREDHKQHDFLDEVETKVYLKEIIDQNLKAASYDVRAFDQFTDALRMKRERTEHDLKKQKMEVLAKCNELIRAIEKRRDAIVNELDGHASDVIAKGDFIHEAITDERRYADALKELMGVVEDYAGDDVSDEPDHRLLRIGEFVDQNEAALVETTISRDLVADVNNYCKQNHEVKILGKKREEIFDLVEDHIYVDSIEDYWLNDEALLAKQHLRHSIDNSICHVGAFREGEFPFYQFLWPITEKYREYYGKETFVLRGNTLQIEEGTTPDLIQGDVFKSNQFQVFVKAGSQRLEKTEVQLFRNTEYSRLFPNGTGNQSNNGLVTFWRNGAEKVMSMVSGSKVIMVKDDRVTGRLHIGKGSKVAAVDRSGNVLIPFLIGKVVIRSQVADFEEVIHLRSDEHAVMYTFDKDREYLWTIDAADNVVKVYDYRKLAFLYGIQSVHE